MEIKFEAAGKFPETWMVVDGVSVRQLQVAFKRERELCDKLGAALTAITSKSVCATQAGGEWCDGMDIAEKARVDYAGRTW